MHKQKGIDSTVRVLCCALIVVLPALIFYFVLVRFCYNLPLLDDYHALLVPIDELGKITSTSNKISYFLGAQHNEYKLWLDVAMAWLQVKLFGHVNFYVLSLLGDSVVLGLGVLLWKLFPLQQKSLADRLLWFAPASWLLFQLSYAETLNWSMAGLQNLPVLLFSFLALGLLVRKRWSYFSASLVCLVLAIAASGNGLLVIPISMLILILEKRYRQLVCWLAGASILVKAYAFHFNLLSSQVATHRSIFVTLKHFSLMYTLAMMGSEASHGSAILGLSLCALNVYLLWTGYFRKFPEIGYCTLFLILTAFGVGGIRSEFGLLQAISSRYQMYCTLLLVFAWFACATRLGMSKYLVLSRWVLASVIFLCAVFAVRKDVGGYKFLKGRELFTLSGMEAYRRSLARGGQLGPVYWVEVPNQAYKEMNPSARRTLADSIRMGTYTPAHLPLLQQSCLLCSSSVIN